MLARVLLLAFGIGLGGSAAQGPEFVQQYMQRLGGHIDELARYVELLDANASATGLSREKALEEYTRLNSLFLQRQAADDRQMITRLEGFRTQQAALENAGPIERVTVFARSFDSEIAAATMKAYRPAVPVTTEGFLFGITGFLAGTVLAELLLRLLRLGFGRRVRPAA